jgi:hypothetical protein
MTIDDGTMEPAQDPGMESGQDTEAVAGGDRDPLGQDVPGGAMGAGEEDAPDLDGDAEGAEPMTS